MPDLVFFDAMREGLWIAVMISAPMLVVALVAGVAIGLFQALTSVQEMTLTFVPKVGAMLVVYWVSMSFMSETLVDFFTSGIIPLIVGS
ncbi:flagellar biosynthetic protein FliQ [Rhodobacter capsulatus]|jgi:flagellar biosynthetic protein FliQ|uniref:Flagellar biosynthetic protein FliQ n=2 Tax=Rhodobacter capsulatus TaxID=1061 RepID=D5ATD0_RHOCB|nr:flagellar biosynthetic protein FliQ [Rhodobacter capsulatus]ADE87241.1 flagellar biosynthetic protein FliQ [Rhodobacter capsulatus SB 1003]ETD03465.1 flagellar biosynthesis protein FliQ [Rhodobacter capsulatus DE442]ETD78070.1 flagellar biosynthesis protein FliQ [Rhodobacter capsulatus B6]ETD80259.1 flagellar biosynthesis protein FliQ [Rhodobacter capsulatus R121]ETD82746.1 flagellar biosynthesis protein FliQ [Rhodobacter capsulatus YW1]